MDAILYWAQIINAAWLSLAILTGLVFVLAGRRGLGGPELTSPPVLSAKVADLVRMFDGLDAYLAEQAGRR